MSKTLLWVNKKLINKNEGLKRIQPLLLPTESQLETYKEYLRVLPQGITILQLLLFLNLSLTLQGSPEFGREDCVCMFSITPLCRQTHSCFRGIFCGETDISCVCTHAQACLCVCLSEDKCVSKLSKNGMQKQLN